MARVRLCRLPESAVVHKILDLKNLRKVERLKQPKKIILCYGRDTMHDNFSPFVVSNFHKVKHTIC
jgi:hypothetical protein